MQARSQAVGFKRQQDLADSVGCSRTQLTKWFAMNKPPARMRKGFDQQLARALKTTRQILFVDYVKVRPEDAADTWGFPLDGAPWLQPDWRDQPPDEKLKSLIYRVGPANLRLLVTLAEGMALAFGSDQMREQEDTILATAAEGRYDSPGLPPLPLHMTPEAIKARRSKRKKA